MNASLNIDEFSKHQSVIITKIIMQWYVITLGILTFFTHLCLLASKITFKTYAHYSLVIFVFVLMLTIWNALKQISVSKTCDWLALGVLTLAALISGYATSHLQPIRPLGSYVDDYDYLSSAMYYLQHAEKVLNLRYYPLYSGREPFFSATFLTSGAYQYIQASFAYLLQADFIYLGNVVISFISGSMLPVIVFLLLTKFTSNTLDAALGALGMLSITILLGEAFASPGGWAFENTFMGKSIVISTGICMVIYFSLEYFQKKGISNWVILALTVTALAGLSTTSIMVIPPLAVIVFISHHILVPNEFHIPSLIESGIKYLIAFVYLLVFTYIVSRIDTAEAGAYANRGYPVDLWYYAQKFINPNIPLTPIMMVLCSATTIILAKSAQRRFMIGMIFLPAIILNPFVSETFLIPYFRGIYFRMFFILPFFLVSGFAVAGMFNLSRSLRPRMRLTVRLISVAIILLLPLLSPTSMVKEMTYFSSKYSDPNYRIAKRAISRTPPGVTLAPYPISCTIYTLDTNRPQLIIRPEDTDYFLWRQGRTDEAKLRAVVADFLDNKTKNTGTSYAAFIEIIKLYPEIQTVILSKETFARVPELQDFLLSQQFSNVFNFNDYLVFWK